MPSTGIHHRTLLASLAGILQGVLLVCAVGGRGLLADDDLLPVDLPAVDSRKVWDHATLEEKQDARSPAIPTPAVSAEAETGAAKSGRMSWDSEAFPSLYGMPPGSIGMPVSVAAPNGTIGSGEPMQSENGPHELPAPPFAPECPLPVDCPASDHLVHVPYQPADFQGTPVPAEPYQPHLDVETYFGKYFNPVQRPWVEWWRPFYTGGVYAPAIPIFSDVNPLTPSFLVYGDYRAAVGIHRDQGAPVRSIANRLNLDFDLRLTGTERIHAFMGPLDHNNRFTRLDFSDSNNIEFEEELDAQFETLFFEGDAGAMTGGWRGVDAPFDLPFTFGRVPLLYQNGIWMEDAVDGVTIAFPWRHSQALNWSNFDATFFAGFHQVTSPAFANDNQAGQVFGTAWFVEAYGGYIEADYAYLYDRDGLDRSYHNMAFAFTRRYGDWLSNSVRVLGNIGQSGPRDQRTADGGLLLLENSLISTSPYNVVPYWNGFLGYGRPQSVARAAGAGGILRNTGINFESDNLTGYPTLDATASNAYGGAVGIQILSADFRRQWVLEFAALDTYGDDQLSAAPGAQYGLGTRWQKALNNWTLVRLDFMTGWLDKTSDIYGTRAEFRWKF